MKEEYEKKINYICEYFNVTPKLVFSMTRKRKIVMIRQLIHYFLREYSSLNLYEIGLIATYYGRKENYNHATVLHSINCVKVNREVNVEFFKDFYNIKNHFDELLETKVDYNEDTLNIILDQIKTKNKIQDKIIEELVKVNEESKTLYKKIKQQQVNIRVSEIESRLLEQFKILSQDKKEDALFKISTMVKVSQLIN